MEKKKYCPSNGSEGMWFTGKFCEQCIHEKFIHTHDDNDKKCDIFTRTIVHDYKDPEYPSEWTYDENGKPTCTAWQKWDWGKDDEGNWNDPPVPEPIDPDQLNLFPVYPDERDFDQPVKLRKDPAPDWEFQPGIDSHEDFTPY